MDLALAARSGSISRRATSRGRPANSDGMALRPRTSAWIRRSGWSHSLFFNSSRTISRRWSCSRLWCIRRSLIDGNAESPHDCGLAGVTARATRRGFLMAAVGAAAVRRDVFIGSPATGVAVMAYAFYVRPRGGEMISIEQRWTRSDTVDVAYVRHSRNHGRAWTAPVEMRTGERRPEGMLRRHPRCGFIDSRGNYIEFWNEGVLPSDDPLEGMKNWNIYFRVSRDGARTFGPTAQIIHAGAEFNAPHPLPGVWTGQNCVMLGDMACAPVNAPNAAILLPVQIPPLTADGKLDNPGRLPV